MNLTRRTLVTALSALAGATILSCAAPASAHGVAHHHPQPAPAELVSVSVEGAGQTPLDTAFAQGRVFVAGEIGQRYVIRLQNNTAERVEAVVSVDGRDVVSGELGNFKKQRGYVLAPFASVRIEGFRRSLEHVAAFRFTDVPDSYSARRQTPQHVGVIGVAAFKERRRRRRARPQPIAPGRVEFDDSGASEPRARTSAPSSAPRASGQAAAESAPSGGDGFAPAPNTSQIGTQFGETMHSSVREVSFKRRRHRRPDQLVTISYDTHEGLRQRGIFTSHHDHDFVHDRFPSALEARPAPRRRFAAPPPPR